MPLYRNCLALGVFGIMALAGSARADSAGEQDEPLRPAITRIMDRAQYANARWGLLQVDVASGRVERSLRGAEMFLPGSSAKLFSVSAVWKVLGPDTRFTTPVYILGSRKGERVEGDLVLVGSGDLTLGGRTKPDGSVDWTNTDHGDANAIPGATLTAEDPLAGIKELARQVRAGGITEVQGNVIVDDRLFTASFEPQPTPVMINDNLIDIVTTPTEPGSPAEVMFRPLSASYVVDATVKTVAAGQPTAITIVGSAPGAITVTGTIAAGSATLVRVAPINDPAAFARTAFKVFAKTGTNVGFDPLGQRLLVQSKALAGFFQRADGQWQVFNLVVNDAGGAPDISAVLSANEDVGEVAAQLWKEANPDGQ
jgi:serine-type D-Ala-D-Ala carboxypeptidase/endopeptidase (penicillin-binding protein 4)